MKRIQYFFVSCSLQDMINIHRLRGKDLATVHESFAIQLNDTHPSIAVAELMRLLVYEHLMDWVQPISQASRTSTRKPYGRSPFRQRER